MKVVIVFAQVDVLGKKIKILADDRDRSKERMDDEEEESEEREENVVEEARDKERNTERRHESIDEEKGHGLVLISVRGEPGEKTK